MESFNLQGKQADHGTTSVKSQAEEVNLRGNFYPPLDSSTLTGQDSIIYIYISLYISIYVCGICIEKGRER